MSSIERTEDETVVAEVAVVVAAVVGLLFEGYMHLTGDDQSYTEFRIYYTHYKKLNIRPFG